MKELADLRVPGAGLAPMKPIEGLDHRYSGARTPFVAASPFRDVRRLAVLAWLGRLATTGLRQDRGMSRTPRIDAHGRGRLGHIAR